jgi:hypothetical protein
MTYNINMNFKILLTILTLTITLPGYAFIDAAISQENA